MLPAGIGLPTEAFGTIEGATVLARVEIGDKRGFIDRQGTLVINPQFDDAGGFSELTPSSTTLGAFQKKGWLA